MEYSSQIYKQQAMAMNNDQNPPLMDFRHHNIILTDNMIETITLNANQQDVTKQVNRRSYINATK